MKKIVYKKLQFLTIYKKNKGCNLLNPYFVVLLSIQWNLDLRKNLNLGKIVATTDFLVNKLFDLRKIFKGLMFDLRKKNSDFLTVLEQFQRKIKKKI